MVQSAKLQSVMGPNMLFFKSKFAFLFKSKVALLLDYDGTLSPIVSHPDLAILPPATRPVLESLASNADVFIAIVSGRGVADVKSKVNIEG